MLPVTGMLHDAVRQLWGVGAGRALTVECTHTTFTLEISSFTRHVDMCDATHGNGPRNS